MLLTILLFASETVIEEVSASSVQSVELTVRNLDHSKMTKGVLDKVVKVSHQLDKYHDREIEY